MLALVVAMAGVRWARPFRPECTHCVGAASAVVVAMAWVALMMAVAAVPVPRLLVVLVVVFGPERLLPHSMAHLHLPVLLEFLHFCWTKLRGQLPQSEPCRSKLECCLSAVCAWCVWPRERLFKVEESDKLGSRCLPDCVRR